MLEHYIQREIVYRLSLVEDERFSSLKPAEIENKLFDYHLKKVIRDGLVEKQVNGAYALTNEGVRIGKGALSSTKRLIDRAYSLLIIAVRNDDGAWLLYKRQSQPQLGKIGFLQAQPTAATDPLITAGEALGQIGIKSTCNVHGHGYIATYREDELVSYIHFTLLLAHTAAPDAVSGQYTWVDDPDFSGDDMLPSMPMLAKMLDEPAGAYEYARFKI